MHCPACSAGADHIEAAAGLAHCGACGHVWERNARPTAGAAAEVRSLPSRPAGVDRRPLPGGGVELRLPWSYDLDASVHLLWVAIVLPLLAAPGLPALVWSSALTALWFALTRNVTTVRVHPAHVEVAHGPVPFPFAWSGTVATRELGPLVLQSRTDHSRQRFTRRGDTITHHTLRAGSHTLLRHWSRRERLAYVEACVSAVTRLPVSQGADVGGSDRLPRQVPPEGVEVQWLDHDVVELELPWSAHAGIAVHGLWVLILPALWSGGFGTFLGLALLAQWAYLTHNRTVVRLEGETVSITHGPLRHPMYADAWFRRSELGLMNVVEGSIPGRYRNTSFFTLNAGSRPLLAHWLDRSKLEYVRACIDVAVRGASARSP